MEIVQGNAQDEDTSEVLRQVHSAVQTLQRPNVVDTSEQVHAQLESGEVAILPGPGDAAPGMFLHVEGSHIVITSQGSLLQILKETAESNNFSLAPLMKYQFQMLSGFQLKTLKGNGITLNVLTLSY